MYVRMSRLDKIRKLACRVRRYVLARGSNATEFVEYGVSGAKDKRRELDRMLAAVRCGYGVQAGSARTLDAPSRAATRGTAGARWGARQRSAFASVAEFDRERTLASAARGLTAHGRSACQRLGRRVDESLRRRIIE